MSDSAETLSLAGRLARLSLLFTAHAMGTANITVVLAAAPAIEHSLGLNHAAFGLMVSVYYGALLVCSIPAGFFADRFGIRIALVFANAATGLGMWVFSQANGMEPAILGLMLCGAGYSLVNPATARGILAWFPARGRATAMGMKQTGVPAGGLLAALAAATIGDWRELAILISLLTLAAAMGYLLFRLAEPAAGAPARIGNISAVLRLRGVIAFNFGACLYATAQGAVLAYLVLFTRDVLAASPGIASLCLGVAHVASAAGRVAWGIASDMIPRNGRLAGLLACGIAAAIGIVALVLSPWIGGLMVLPAIAALLGLTVVGYAGLAQTAAAEAVEPRLAGAAIGYNMLLTNSGMMLGPVLFGMSVQSMGYSASWIGLAAIVLLGAALFYVGLTAPQLARKTNEGRPP